MGMMPGIQIDPFPIVNDDQIDKLCITIRLENINNFISRSQARKILKGLELFREIILDFKDVEYMGQAFADEIFRVFKNTNLNTVIIAQNANIDVQNMINRAINTKI